MSGTYLVFSTLLTIVVSVLVVRAGAVLLTLTGMHYSQARFQALSAFSGTGFTTRAAEAVVNHPRRRNIVSWLMLLGNAGIVVVIVTATSSFMNTDVEILPLNLLLLSAGVVGIYYVASRTGLGRRWEAFVEKRIAGSVVFEEEPLEDLLHVADGYGAVRLRVDNPAMLQDRMSSGGTTLDDYLVVGIERGKLWMPPVPSTVKAGDQLVVYGRLSDLKGLFAAHSVAGSEGGRT